MLLHNRRFLVALLALFSTANAAVPTLTTMARVVGIDTQLLSECLEDLDFYHSRGFECTLAFRGFAPRDVHKNAPLTISYKGRWNYKAAGDRTKPFAGFDAAISARFTYDGLSIDPSQAASLRKTLDTFTAPIRTFTGTQEFFFKLITLLWTEAHSEEPNLAVITSHIDTLLARLKLTPGGSECSLGGIRILSEPGQPSLESFFAHAPQLVTTNLLSAAKKTFTSLGLLKSDGQESEMDHVIDLMAAVNYFSDTTVSCTLPKGGSLTLPFGYAGSGEAHQPFTGLSMTVEVPTQTRTVISPTPLTNMRIELQPEHECLIRCFLLILEHRKKPMPIYKLSEEFSILFSRLSVTTTVHLPPTVRALLQMACSFHQYLAHHDFSRPIAGPLDIQELFIQLLCIVYRTYTLYSDLRLGIDTTKTPQDIVDFATVHTAEALRSFRGIITLKKKCQQAIVLSKEDKTTINVELFFKTLLGENSSEPSAL